MSRPERTKPLGNRAPSDRPALLNRRPSRSLPGASSSTKPPRDTTSAAQISTSTSGRSLTSSKPARTSKTTQKLVLLPEQPQTLPLPTLDEDDAHGYETDAGVKVREHKSVGERMSKSERRKAGYRRITALKVCQSFKMKLLASFLKREHNVTPRAYDDALYVMYHLPLLPGYSHGVNVRSSTPPEDRLSRMSQADETGYQGTYFNTTSEDPSFSLRDGYIKSSSPEETRKVKFPGGEDTEIEASGVETEAEEEPLLRRTEAEALMTDAEPTLPRSDSEARTIRPSVSQYSMGDDEAAAARERERQQSQEGNEAVRDYVESERREELETELDRERDRADVQNTAEVVFFAYGVVVFSGLEESQERSILEDVENAGVVRRKIEEDDWEVEECHFDYDPTIQYPRIYNDFFTFKSPSHLLTLSIAHALAQSSLLSHYETLTRSILLDPKTVAIPRQMATEGALKLSRTQAMKLTGRLFRLRRDVVLGGNVLDVPELFWEETSLRGLYDGVREYFEIGQRVSSLNEKLVGANDLLDAIHDHLNNSAMERITWIIIWLIVAAILVELGEVIARLIVHWTLGSNRSALSSVASSDVVRNVTQLSREEALERLEQMILKGNFGAD